MRILTNRTAKSTTTTNTLLPMSIRNLVVSNQKSYFVVSSQIKILSKQINQNVLSTGFKTYQNQQQAIIQITIHTLKILTFMRLTSIHISTHVFHALEHLYLTY